MDLDKHFTSLRKTQVDDFAMGADLFAKMLYANERVDAPLDELERIGREDLKRNQDAMAKECAIYAPGKTIMECVAIEESHKPEGGDFVGYARKQLVDLRQFVIDHDVVTVPGEELAMVKQSPPYNAQNGAYIDPSPPFAKNLPAFYNIAAPDPTWSKAETGRLHSGQGEPAVHVSARSLAGALPAIPAFEPRGVDVRKSLCRLRVRRRLGALCRGDDVG